MRRRTLLASASLSLVAGCTASASSGSGKDRPEKASVRIGYLPIPSNAVIFMAIRYGYFQKNLVKAQPVLFQGGADAIPKLLAGEIDVTYTNVISVVQAYVAGAPIRILAENDEQAPGEDLIMVAGNSRINEVADLKGRRIGVNTRKNVGELLVTATLFEHNIDVIKDRIAFTAVDFPQMTNALKTGAVDAVWTTEPFVTQAEIVIGARQIADTSDGLPDFPLGVFATTADFIERYPNTATAFQRSIRSAQELASANQREVVTILPAYTPINHTTASLIAIGDFATSTNPIRLQRTVTLMRDFGYLNQDLDIKNLIV